NTLERGPQLTGWAVERGGFAPPTRTTKSLRSLRLQAPTPPVQQLERNPELSPKGTYVRAYRHAANGCLLELRAVMTTRFGHVLLIGLFPYYRVSLLGCTPPVPHQVCLSSQAR